VVREGGAEVAAEDLAQVVEVLDDQGAVVPGLVDAGLELRRRQLAAESGGDRVARMKIVGMMSSARITR